MTQERPTFDETFPYVETWDELTLSALAEAAKARGELGTSDAEIDVEDHIILGEN